MTGAVLDAGALIGFERNDRVVVAIVRRALDHGDEFVVPAGVVAQVWRDGRRQARLSRLLASPVTRVEPLDDTGARAAGQLLGVAGTAYVVDASVALVARARRLRVITSDGADLLRLDPTLDLVDV